MLTFPNVSPAVFALVLDQLRKEGSQVREADSNNAAIKQVNQYLITGHHWPLGDIRANVAYDGNTVTVDVVKPSVWESQIGGRIEDAISDAKRKVAGGVE